MKDYHWMSIGTAAVFMSFFIPIERDCRSWFMAGIVGMQLVMLIKQLTETEREYQE